MAQTKATIMVLLLTAVVLGPPVSELSTSCQAVTMEIPIEGAVYHVQRSDGSHHTYLDIVVGSGFKGQLPDDIAGITVTGPEGELPVGLADFNYNPQ